MENNHNFKSLYYVLGDQIESLKSFLVTVKDHHARRKLAIILDQMAIQQDKLREWADRYLKDWD